MPGQFTLNTTLFKKNKSKVTSMTASDIVAKTGVPEVKQALVGVLGYVEVWWLLYLFASTEYSG